MVQHKILEKGTKIGNLTVVNLAFKKLNNNQKSYSYYYTFKCDCGNECIRNYADVRKSIKKHNISCCHECAKKINQQHNTIHGLSKSGLKHSWDSMKRRCYDKTDKTYKYYGARGITICNEWLEHPYLFMEWGLKNGWKEGLTIDRIDVNGNYEPNNCRFVTNTEQQHNKRNNVFVEYNDKKYCVAELSRILNIKDWILRKKIIKNGYNINNI